MARIGELADEHVGQQQCDECSCTRSILVLVRTQRQSKVFINRIETQIEWWCPTCVREHEIL